jgi:hypothetical protein
MEEYEWIGTGKWFRRNNRYNVGSGNKRKSEERQDSEERMDK